jgi:DNA invertase Pin-like site-specific DNA recombinase
VSCLREVPAQRRAPDAEHACHVRSSTEHIDTRTAAGKRLYAVLGAVAQLESDVMRERTIAGLQAAKSRGERIGRPLALTPAEIREAKKMLKPEAMPSRESVHQRLNGNACRNQGHVSSILWHRSNKQYCRQVISANCRVLCEHTET